MSASSKGTWLDIYIQILKKEKGTEAIRQFEKKFGTSKFSGFKDYPGELISQITSEVSQMLFGKETNETHFKLGYLSFESFAQTQMGKIIFKLYNTNAIGIAKNIIPVVKSVTNLNILPKEIKDEKVVLEFKDSTYSSHYYHGMIMAASKQFCIPVTKVEIKEKDHSNYTLTIYWDLHHTNAVQ